MDGRAERNVFDEAYEAVSGGQYWFITLLLNIALGYLDERRLRKAGVDTTTFGKLAWLVPFYLWRRAKPSVRNRLTSGYGL